MICPVCGKGELLRYSGVPDILDLQKIIKSHPVPVLRNWAADKASEIKTTVEKRYYYRRCNKCGFIAIFERGEEYE